MKKYFIQILILAITCSNALSQSGNFKQSFIDANFHYINNNYALALPIYQKLLEEDADNANLNYKVGLCYMLKYNEKTEAIPYLEKAIKDISKNYDPFAHTIKKAGPDAKYYLALAYHLNYEFKKAIKMFAEFNESVSEKHMLRTTAEHNIEQSNNAMDYVQNPIKIDVINLGDSINTRYAEYSPVLEVTENTMLFTSKREGSTGGFRTDQGYYHEDIYSSKRVNGVWTKPLQLGRHINTNGDDAVLGISADGQKMYMYRSENKGGNIYVSENTGVEWSMPVLLGSDVNSKDWETHAVINAQENVLFFVSDRKSGFGGRDIYRCVKLPDGTWSKAANIGPDINTEYDEECPYIHQDGIHFYFASKGHKNMGGFDMYVSEMSTENGEIMFTKPENLGYPINTVNNDMYLTVSSDGKRAYYSSERPEGYGDKDIYMLNLNILDIEPLTVFVGKFLCMDENTVAGASVTDLQTGEIFWFKANRKTGKFTVIIPSGMQYQINHVANGDTLRSEEIVNVPISSSYKAIFRPVTIPALCADEVDNSFAYGRLFYDEAGALQVMFISGNDTLIQSISSSEVEFNMANLASIQQSLNHIDGLENNGNFNMKYTRMTIDDGNGIKMEVVTDEFGFFEFSSLNKNLDYVLEIDHSSIPKEVKEKLNIGKTEDELGNIIFEEHFDYNMKDLEKESKNFSSMIDKITSQIANTKSPAKVRILASASKVPTRKYKSNKELAEVRAASGKVNIIVALQNAGFVQDDIIFVEKRATVTGPRYRNDAYSNRDEYKKYQFFKVRLIEPIGDK
ncbi:MAG: PD40 domain-containing protein [Flavobacteriales bacterium]|nr:PD40 domain-containing protein [Flavobacteriales bacterium]